MADDFGAQVRRWTEETERRMGQVLRKSALGAFTEVINISPVDTGRFRGNWQTSIGAPAGGVLSTTGAGVSIARAQGAVSGAEPGDTIFMVNNLPRAGWSA